MSKNHMKMVQKSHENKSRVKIAKIKELGKNHPKIMNQAKIKSHIKMNCVKIM